MKDELMKYKNQGFSMRQLFALGKAITLELPLDDIANKNLSPKEMNKMIEELAKKERSN